MIIPITETSYPPVSDYLIYRTQNPNRNSYITTSRNTSMNEISLNPDEYAIRRFMLRAVNQNLSDSPVRYAFTYDWPITLTRLEAQEVLQAVRNTQPDLRNPHGTEHKQITIKRLMQHIGEAKKPTISTNTPSNTENN